MSAPDIDDGEMVIEDPLTPEQLDYQLQRYRINRRDRKYFAWIVRQANLVVYVDDPL